MKLLTKEILAAFKRQGDTADKYSKDIKIIAKFFNPCGRETWYATEYDHKTKTFYGFISVSDVYRDEPCGFSLKELRNIRLPCGLRIERDKFFKTGKYTLEDIIEGKRP